MGETPDIFCEHIKIGDQALYDDLEDDSQVETTPAFRCGLVEQPCRFATRKRLCPVYQEYLLDRTAGGLNESRS